MIAVVYARKPCQWHPSAGLVSDVEIVGTSLVRDTLAWLAHWGVDRASVVSASGKYAPSPSWDSPLELFAPEDLPPFSEPLVAVDCIALQRMRLDVALDVLERSSAELLCPLSPTGNDARRPLALGRPDAMLQSIQEVDSGPRMTNLSLTGTAVASGSSAALIASNPQAFDPSDPTALIDPAVVAVETVGGYFRCVDSPRSFLLCCHDVLSRKVVPWFGSPIPKEGTVVEEPATVLSPLQGHCWIGEGARIGTNCCIESCVVMSEAFVGEGCRLKHVLVLPGCRVKPRTIMEDKYLSVIGWDGE
ncbi:hypothetical protein GF402_04605 [Candidatus Fermentibacteria bacterium]|nr:hypothetical protein [Candidatus Fermentibacteria bacterium]